MHPYHAQTPPCSARDSAKTGRRRAYGGTRIKRDGIHRTRPTRQSCGYFHTNSLKPDDYLDGKSRCLANLVLRRPWQCAPRGASLLRQPTANVN